MVNEGVRLRILPGRMEIQVRKSNHGRTTGQEAWHHAPSASACPRAHRAPVGAATDIPSTTVSRIETGSFEAPRPDKLARIAQALELSAGELFAQAGYLVATDLPEYATYLRTKRPDLPESAIKSLHDHFMEILNQLGLDPTRQLASEEFGLDAGSQSS